MIFKNFDPPHKSQGHLDPSTDYKSISILPDKKNMLISIQSLNQVIFEPRTKPSQFRSLHEIVSIPIPHAEIKSISTIDTTTKLIAMSTLKPCHFRPVLVCVGYIFADTCVPVKKHQCVSYNTSKYYVGIYHVLYITTLYTHDYVLYWWPDFVTFHPSWT